MLKFFRKLVVGFGIAVFGLIVLTVLLLMFVMRRPSERRIVDRVEAPPAISEAKREPKPTTKPTDLIYVARQMVRAKMKNPNGAKFPLPESGDYAVATLSGGRYRVGGWVEGTNSFNAVIRSRWIVEMETLNGDDWKPLKVVID